MLPRLILAATLALATPALADPAKTTAEGSAEARLSTQVINYRFYYRAGSAYSRDQAARAARFRTFARSPACPEYAGVLYRGNLYCFKQR